MPPGANRGTKARRQNLEDAARAILQGSSKASQDTLESDLAAQGLDISTLEPWRLEQLQEGADDFLLWEEHVPVVELFLRCVRQWRTAGEAFLGIDYGALSWVCKLSNIEPTLPLLDDFQIMEAQAVEILNKAPKDKKKKGRKA